MKRILYALFILLATQQTYAQHVYQIRADSVRIYNVCDTAELIIENRTRGVAGFLYNKGNGRTEFRRLRLETIGGNKIAITGQDTLDISTLPGIGGVDTIYRNGDNILYVKRGVTHTVYAPFADITGNWGQQTSHNEMTDFNSINKFGSTYVKGVSGPPANNPGNGNNQYYSWAYGLGSEYPVNLYNLQFTMGRSGGGGSDAGPYLYRRFNESSSYTPWEKIWAGNADQVGGINADRIIYGDNPRGTTTVVGSLNAINKSGFYDISSATGGAPSTEWYNVIHSEHVNSTDYGNQLAQKFTNVTEPEWFIRTKQAGIWGAWRNLWHAGNFNPDSKANTTGSYPGLSVGAATDATNLGGRPASDYALAGSIGSYIENQISQPQSGNLWVSGAGRFGAGGAGNVTIMSGASNKTGYVEFNRSNGIRNGYIGYDEADIFYMKEDGGRHVFKGGPAQFDNRVYSSDGFRTNSYIGMIGDYDENTTNPKIIWTIGQSWISLAANGNGYYGLGYEYGVNGGKTSHQIVLANAGTIKTRLNMDGGITTDGQISTSSIGRFGGWYTGGGGYGASGPAAEIGISNNTAYLIGYNRDISKYLNTWIEGRGVALKSYNDAGALRYDFNSNEDAFTYGSWYATGERNGWSGIAFPYASTVPTLMYNSSGIGGIFAQNSNTWQIYWNGSNILIGGTYEVYHTGNLPIDVEATANTIAKRDASGQIKATAFYQSSHSSLKKDIKDFTEPALPLINGLVIKEFVYKNDAENNQHIGIIADHSNWRFATKKQDRFDTNSSLAIAIKAIQELSKEKDALEQQVRSLEERMAKLEKLLEASTK